MEWLFVLGFRFLVALAAAIALFAYVRGWAHMRAVAAEVLTRPKALAVVGPFDDAAVFAGALASLGLGTASSALSRRVEASADEFALAIDTKFGAQLFPPSPQEIVRYAAAIQRQQSHPGRHR